MSCMRSTVTVTVLLVGIAMGTAAAAPSDVPEFRCPTPGTIIVSKAGISIALRNGAPMHCVSKTNGVETDTILHMIPARDEHAEQLREEIGKIWPLKVGYSQVFYVGLPQEPIVNHLAVTRKVGVDTPAGHFDTYVIEWSQLAANCGAILDEINRYYYAPALAATVKYEHEYGYGGDKMSDKTADWEALKIVVPADLTPPAMSRRQPQSLHSSLNERGAPQY